MGSVKKAVESVVEAPVDLVKSVAKGDIGGILDVGARAATMGTLGVKKSGGALVTAEGAAKSIAGKTPKVSNTSQVEELKEQADKTSKQRQALFMTEGGILGEEVESVGKKKRGTILGN